MGQFGLATPFEFGARTAGTGVVATGAWGLVMKGFVVGQGTLVAHLVTIAVGLDGGSLIAVKTPGGFLFVHNIGLG